MQKYIDYQHIKFCRKIPNKYKNKRFKEIFKMLESENIDSIIIQTRFWTTSYFASKFIAKIIYLPV